MILTRRIKTAALLDHSGDLREGAAMEFEVADDPGSTGGIKLLAANLYISRMKSYSNNYYISVTYGDEEVARTGIVGAFDEKETTLKLEYLQTQLMSENPWRIQLINVATGGTTGNKCNYRQGCYVQLEIEYEMPDPVYNEVFYYNGKEWILSDTKYYDGKEWLQCDVLYTADGIKFK